MRPVVGTRLIAAYGALRGALTVALTEKSVQVLDGARVAEDLADDVLLFGYSPDAGVSLTHNRVGVGIRVDETIEVRCWFSTWSGDTDLTARHARVEEVLDVIAAVCAVDRPLAGAVDRLTFGPGIDMQQAQTPDGAVVEVAFSLIGQIVR